MGLSYNQSTESSKTRRQSDLFCLIELRFEDSGKLFEDSFSEELNWHFTLYSYNRIIQSIMNLNM